MKKSVVFWLIQLSNISLEIILNLQNDRLAADGIETKKNLKYRLPNDAKEAMNLGAFLL